MHLFHLSLLRPNITYNCIQPAADPSNGPIVSIPVEQTDSHYEVIVTRMSALWRPLRSLEIPAGKTYTVGEFTLHIGELRANNVKRQGPSSVNFLCPAIVVYITTNIGATGVHGLPSVAPGLIDENLPGLDKAVFEGAQTCIREFWNSIKQDVAFGRGEIRESMQMERDFEGKKTQEQEAIVRMWCDALLSRA
jgi:hypothetical protein